MPDATILDIWCERDSLITMIKDLVGRFSVNIPFSGLVRNVKSARDCCGERHFPRFYEIVSDLAQVNMAHFIVTYLDGQI